jgi:glycosyltransferase involved in cell wall biosynthesis
MKLAINIPTYYRSDGKSISFLKTALDSVFNQTHQDFKIYLIGDKYENEPELIDLVSTYDSDRLFFKNLPYAKERDKYIDNKWALWSYGGINATNIGVEAALNDGYEYICHLDHDDWWLSNHLFEINKCIEETNADWICTKSTYEHSYLPNIESSELYHEFLPKNAGLIHSSVCMNFKTIPLRYRDLFELNNFVGLPADADLWERCRMVIQSSNLKSIFINKLTCRHDEEGYHKP